MQVRLLAKTQGVEGTEYYGKSIDEVLVGIARLSSSREVNEMFQEPEKLLRHCLLNGHWSVFSESNLIIEIVTSRAMGREFLRHWSMKPQEFSQRYAPVTNFEPVELRTQCKNNRQSSTDLFTDKIKERYWNIQEGDFEFIETDANSAVKNLLEDIEYLYRELLDKGVASETARFILPETAQTRMVFNAPIREWITTINLRVHKTAQKEAREVAEAIKDIFIKECPIISKALYNFEDSYEVHILDRLILEKFGCYNLVKNNEFKKLK